MAKRLFPGICDAIAELHGRFDPPLIHRDIKPSNFMVDGDTVLVIDLGFARTFDKDAACDTSHFGTRAYAPPEQFGYGQTDVRSDIYALGMVLFCLLCEETPVPSTVQQRLSVHGVPESVRNVVAQATAFDPADRFGSVAAMRAAFVYAVGPAVSAAEPCAPASRDAKERGAFKAFAHGAKAALQWLRDFLPDIVHRLPLGVGVAWDILLAAWGRDHGLRVRYLRHEPARGHGSFACSRLCGVIYMRVAGPGLADPIARRHAAAGDAVRLV